MKLWKKRENIGEIEIDGQKYVHCTAEDCEHDTKHMKRQKYGKPLMFLFL